MRKVITESQLNAIVNEVLNEAVRRYRESRLTESIRPRLRRANRRCLISESTRRKLKRLIG